MPSANEKNPRPTFGLVGFFSLPSATSNPRIVPKTFLRFFIQVFTNPNIRPSQYYRISNITQYAT